MRELVNAQLTLLSYISKLTANSQDARDILQELNQRICRDSGNYDASRPFLPWVKTLAVYEVMTWRKKQARDRLIFNDEVFEYVVEEAKTLPDESERRLVWLDICLEKLPALWCQILERHYTRSMKVKAIARQLKRTPNTVSLILMRARRALADCIEQGLRQELAGEETKP